MPKKFWNTNLILKTYRGSLTYGTNITKQEAKDTIFEESDVDSHGICVPPRDYLLSWDFVWGDKRFEQYEEGEYTCFSLLKYIQLAMNCNPNIIEMLFVEPKFILFVDPIGQRLIDNRHIFLTKKAKHTFGGYAYSQIQKIKSKKRNQSGRQHLIEEFGYDTKFAMHAIRLLQMGVEILAEGEVNVFRPNNQELKDIRMGKMSEEDFFEISKHWMRLLDASYATSDLPYGPDKNAIKELCKDLHEDFWERRGGDGN